MQKVISKNYIFFYPIKPPNKTDAVLNPDVSSFYSGSTPYEDAPAQLMALTGLGTLGRSRTWQKQYTSQLFVEHLWILD